MEMQLLALLALVWHTPGPDLSDERAEAMRQACTTLVVQYAYSRDRLDYEAYGALFTEDATFELAGQKTEGRKAIVAALRQRGPQMITRHFSTPVAFEPQSSTTARGVAYLQLFRVGADTDAPHPYDQAPLIAEYHDEYEVDEASCRFRSRRIKLVMTPADD